VCARVTSRRGSAPGRRPVERGAREAPACAALGRLCRRGRRPPGSLARGQLGEPVGARGGGARGSGAEGGGGASGPARVRGHSAGCMAVVRLGSKGAAGTESASSVVVVVTTAVSTRWETLLCACVGGCWPAVAGTWARMGGFSAFPLPGPLESGVCQRLVPSARCAPAPRTPRGRAPPRPPADVGRQSAWAPAGEAQAASGRAAEGGGERSFSGARQAPPPPPGRLTWAGAPPARRWGRARGRGLGGPLGARQSPGEGGRRLIPGIPRAPALASAAEPALGARRPRVRLGVRSGRGQCGARARRRLRVGAPPECAPRSRPCLCPQRGPAGPRWARREPPGGECGRTGPGEGWLAGKSGMG